MIAPSRPGAWNPARPLDDFDLLALLGKGAFARVFLARQRSMQRLVALKVSADPGPRPQTLAQLDHPHIVRVFDQRACCPSAACDCCTCSTSPAARCRRCWTCCRKTPPAGRGTGGRLPRRRWTRRWRGAASRRRPGRRCGPAGGVDWPEAVCWLGARLAEALDYAHRQGVLHRDVKPANVLLTAEGSPKLADFNVSFSCKLDGANPAAFFGGSLAYMSPEQLEAFNPAHGRDPGDLDGRSRPLLAVPDVLWELLAGRRPFRRRDAVGGLGGHAGRP